MGKLFGTNGVRGIFAQDFTLEFVHDLTLAISSYFGKGPILVGYDGRTSSPVIAKVVCATLNYAGLDCKIAGLVPTPCLELATKNLGYSGGIMITASHNPPQYNGIKPIANDGVEISRNDEQKIEEIYFDKKSQKEYLGGGTTEKEDRALEVYLEAIKSQVNVSKIISKKFKVVIDIGNGAQAMAAPQLCQELGCQVTTINENIDGMFSGRGSEPTPQNLAHLSKTVVENKADIGIAFDGDGDRSLFCDERGEILTGDRSALLLSKFLLKKNPKSTIVTCLNSSFNIEVLAKETNSQVVRTKVGSVEVSRKMTEIGALIGFEENGGFMFGKHNQVRDGAMTLALMLDLLAESGKTVSQETAELPPSFTTKDKISCSKENAEKIIKVLAEQNPNSDTTDGIKIVFDSRNWIMVRPSGTEPIVRVYGEADSQQKLDKLMSQYIEKIKSIISR